VIRQILSDIYDRVHGHGNKSLGPDTLYYGAVPFPGLLFAPQIFRRYPRAVYSIPFPFEDPGNPDGCTGPDDLKQARVVWYHECQEFLT